MNLFTGFSREYLERLTLSDLFMWLIVTRYSLATPCSCGNFRTCTYHFSALATNCNRSPQTPATIMMTLKELFQHLQNNCSNSRKPIHTPSLTAYKYMYIRSVILRCIAIV